MGKILARVEAEGFTVRAARMIHMSKAEAEGFYHVHRERPFFGGLTGKTLLYIGLAAVAVGGILTIDKNVLDVTPSSLGTRQD